MSETMANKSGAPLPPPFVPSSNPSGRGPGAPNTSTSAKPQLRRRTKTGCLTCRKRRIKCGEERPECKNCRKSKRHCEGYNPPLVFRTGAPHVLSTQPIQFHSSGLPGTRQYVHMPPDAFAVSQQPNYRGIPGTPGIPVDAQGHVYTYPPGPPYDHQAHPFPYHEQYPPHLPAPGSYDTSSVGYLHSTQPEVQLQTPQSAPPQVSTSSQFPFPPAPNMPQGHAGDPLHYHQGPSLEGSYPQTPQGYMAGDVHFPISTGQQDFRHASATALPTPPAASQPGPTDWANDIQTVPPEFGQTSGFWDPSTPAFSSQQVPRGLQTLPTEPAQFDASQEAVFRQYYELAGKLWRFFSDVPCHAPLPCFASRCFLLWYEY